MLYLLFCCLTLFCFICRPCLPFTIFHFHFSEPCRERMIYGTGCIDAERNFSIAMKQMKRTHLFEVNAIETCFYIIIALTAT